MKLLHVLSALVILGVTEAHASTLENVVKRGSVRCSVTAGTPGFSLPNNDGKYVGLDVDVCRAVAAAIFGDPEKVTFIPLTAASRFTALQSGEIDILLNTTTWTLGREATNGILFAGVNYYDGQGILVRSGEIKSARELDGATVCTNQGSTTELNLVDFFRTHRTKNEIVAFASQQEALNAYQAGRCDAFSSDRSVLYAYRSKLNDPGRHIVLDEVLSKEPLGPSVRQGDDRWFNVVRWCLYALHAAEEAGLTSENVDNVASTTTNPDILRLLGKEGTFGTALGLRNDWAYQIISKVGSYAEIFERNIGEKSPLKIARGINASWKNGGLHYAPPIR